MALDSCLLPLHFFLSPLAMVLGALPDLGAAAGQQGGRQQEEGHQAAATCSGVAYGLSWNPRVSLYVCLLSVCDRKHVLGKNWFVRAEHIYKTGFTHPVG
jgi:hypothetical protein